VLAYNSLGQPTNKFLVPAKRSQIPFDDDDFTYHHGGRSWSNSFRDLFCDRVECSSPSRAAAPSDSDQEKESAESAGGREGDNIDVVSQSQLFIIIIVIITIIYQR
jgi:hypothetical protein